MVINLWIWQTGSLSFWAFTIFSPTKLKGNLDEVLGYYHKAYKLAEKTSPGGPSEVCILSRHWLSKAGTIRQCWTRYHVYLEPLQVSVWSKISPGIVDMEYPGNVILVIWKRKRLFRPLLQKTTTTLLMYYSNLRKQEDTGADIESNHCVPAA